MHPSIPFYSLIVIPVAVAIALFWRRAGRHVEVLRFGRPSTAQSSAGADQGAGRLRLRPEAAAPGPGPGTDPRLHLLGLPGAAGDDRQLHHERAGGGDRRLAARRLLWRIVVVFANLFIGLMLLSLGYFAVAGSRRPARLALSRDAFMILGLIFAIVLTELARRRIPLRRRSRSPSRTLRVPRRAVRLALDGIGPDAGVDRLRRVGLVAHPARAGVPAYLPYSKHLHIITSEPNVYFRNLEPRGALRLMDLEAEPEPTVRSRSSAPRA